MTTDVTASGTVGVLDQTRPLVTEICRQFQFMKEVNGKCNQLTKGLDEIDKILHQLQKRDAGSTPEMGKRQAPAISEYVENTRKALEEVVGKGKPLSKAEVVLQARKVSEVLDERIDRLEDMELRGPVLGYATHQAKPSQTPLNTDEDRFVTQFNDHSTSKGLVLSSDDDTTPEGGLNQKIASSDANMVGAVGRQVTAAQGMSGVAKACMGCWRKKAIDGHKQRHLRNSASGEAVEWWSEKLVDDSCMHSNLARHLLGSGMVKELKKLLFDYRWTRRQLELNRLLGLERDF